MERWLLIGALAGGLLVAAIAAWLAGRVRRRRQRASAHGRRMEAQAPAMLEAMGYTVIARHPERAVRWFVDGEPRETVLRADLLVTRGRRRYAVEVKTGGATQVEKGATRRQLLEYAVHYAVDGVLLFDADRRLLREVRFPLTHRRRRWPWFVIGLLIGAITALAWHTLG